MSELRRTEIQDEHRHQRDAATITNLRIIARRHGYNLVVHGSRSPKDLDLIAIPWTAKAIAPLRLIRMFVKQEKLWRGERISETKAGELVPNKPHGRMAYILIRPTDQRHIDLSITARISAHNEPKKDES